MKQSQASADEQDRGAGVHIYIYNVTHTDLDLVLSFLRSLRKVAFILNNVVINYTFKMKKTGQEDQHWPLGQVDKSRRGG